MKMALELAERGQGWTSPNPLVGAVIAKDGTLVGRGFHQTAGGPHAEIHALNDAGDKARGATLYVTLEPCNHEGRTPPCTHAILKSGIKRVVAGMKDPNPRVTGGGLAFLRTQGLDVTAGVCENAESGLIFSAKSAKLELRHGERLPSPCAHRNRPVIRPGGCHWRGWYNIYDKEKPGP